VARGSALEQSLERRAEAADALEPSRRGPAARGGSRPGSGPSEPSTPRRAGRRASARAVALDVLCRVERDGAWADRLLDARLRDPGLDPRDRALATELTYGTLRWQRLIDFHVASASHRPVGTQDPWVRALLRLGTYQLGWLDRVPAWAAVHEAVELAKGRRPRGAAHFVNGVLRSLAARPRPWPEPVAGPGDDPLDVLALRTSQPTWLVRRWARRLGLEEAEALARAMNERPPLVLRVNTLRASIADVVAALEAAGARVGSPRYAAEALVLADAGDPARLPPIEDGRATVQDEAAILVGHALGPEAGETVADVCAAPGTKTTHLAQLMGNRGRILAVDPHPGRLGLLEEACRRLGATIVEARSGGAATLARDVGPVCDRVLVDAPCSNLGVLRRNPDGKWRRQLSDLSLLAATQGTILDEAAGLVCPGGVLVYATCSLEPEENEAVIEAFRARRPDFAPDALPAAVPAACRDAPDRLRMTPARHGSDGFTAHRLRRRP
jgi:16S rRNA (cytosine967-C5)-methyltransferase